MRSKTYEIPFDESTGRFKAETILADVVKVGLDDPCEIESAKFTFPTEILKLDFDFLPGSTEVRAEATLVDEVYDSAEFFTVIGEEYEVELLLVRCLSELHEAPLMMLLNMQINENSLDEP